MEKVLVRVFFAVPEWNPGFPKGFPKKNVWVEKNWILTEAELVAICKICVEMAFMTEVGCMTVNTAYK